MNSCIKILRPLNLLIVGLTQWIIIFYVFGKFFRVSNLSGILDSHLGYIFILVTMLITAGGYIINDILDEKADVVNKASKVFINQSFTKKHAFILYSALSILGLILSVYVASSVGNIFLSSIYLVAVLALYIYSKFLKQSYLLGNLLVASFTSGVFYILLFAERQTILDLSKIDLDSAARLSNLILAFCVFSFIINLLREIVKDIEDLEGDRQVGYKTMPVVSGEKHARNLGLSISIVLLIAGIYFLSISADSIDIYQMATIGSMFILQLIISINLYLAKQKLDYSKLSKLIKLEMLFGLILLVQLSQL